MVSLTILAFDALFVLLALAFAAWSTRDKLAHGAPSSVPSKSAAVRARVPAASAGQPAGVLVDVLVRMGFKPLQAERAADEIGDSRNEPLDAQVREALRVLCHGAGRVGV
jgi:Holliday junction resolvasome RuvABC DNA-binding subunit